MHSSLSRYTIVVPSPDPLKHIPACDSRIAAVRHFLSLRQFPQNPAKSIATYDQVSCRKRSIKLLVGSGPMACTTSALYSSTDRACME